MSKRSSWFRFYDRMIDSPQVLELSDGEFRLLVSLWCVANAQEQGGQIPFSPRAIQRRVMPEHSTEDVSAMLAHLVELDLLATTDNGYAVCRWDTHQYQYPSWEPEARRKQKQTERATTRKHVASMSQDVARTDTEREKDTDTERDQTQKGPSSGKGFSTERERHPTPEGSREQRPAHGSLSPSNNLPSTPPTATASTRQPPPRPAPPDASEPPPNTDAQLYDALVTAIGQAPTTRAAKAEWGAWLRQLAEARASPAQIAERCLIYRRRYGPEIPLTPRALVRQWDQLTSESPGGVAHATAATTTLAAASAAVEDRRRAERERLAEEKRRAAQEILGDLNTWPGRAEQRGAAPARTQPAANGYGAGAARG